MMRVGFVGWRGMVGSVLLQRMCAENDFADIDPVFLTTSQVGQPGPNVGRPVVPLEDAHSIDLLREMDVVVSCQGGNYTEAVVGPLRKSGWKGYWLDAASTLRMESDSLIVLDPVNRTLIDRSLEQGCRQFIGGNCTVSLMLMAIGSLFQQGLVEWVSSMTYQAASGAGAKAMKELLLQMGAIQNCTASDLSNPAISVLEVERKASELLRSHSLPCEAIGVPLAGSVIPYIDQQLESGQSREEWKAGAETNRILGLSSSERVEVDGICVRVGALRCHSQALTVKLTRDVPLAEINSLLSSYNPWISLVDNSREESIQKLTPAAVSGSLDIALGRVRKLAMGERYLSVFTVGDQLLWGAAEPLRRMLRLLV